MAQAVRIRSVRLQRAVGMGGGKVAAIGALSFVDIKFMDQMSKDEQFLFPLMYYAR